MKAIFAGAFDPFTLGHRDICERASRIFGNVTVAVAESTGKNTVSLEKRVDIARLSVDGIAGVDVEPFRGLLSDYIKKSGECVLVRGVRGTNDFEYERDRLRVYSSLCGADAVLLVTKPELEHVSSTVVRELAALGSPLDGYAAAKAKDVIKSVYRKFWE